MLFVPEDVDDLLPLLCREVEATAFTPPPCGGIAMRQLCAILGIVVGAIAREFTADGTGRALERAGDFCI